MAGVLSNKKIDADTKVFEAYLFHILEESDYK